MHILYIFLSFSSCFPAAFAQYSPSEFCFRSCEQALRSSVRFNATDPVSGETCTPQTCDCVHRAAVTSLYLCTKLYCSDGETARGLKGLNETCKATAEVSLPPFSLVDEYDEEQRKRLRHFGRADAKEWNEVFPSSNDVVVIDESLYRLAYDTLDAAYFEIRTHWTYGILMYVFWVVVMIVGLTSHVARFLAEQEQKWEQIPETDSAALESSIKRKESYFRLPYTFLKRYITVPATFGYRKSQNISWWATIPTRVQGITIGTFVAINIYLCSVDYHVVVGNLYWKAEHTQMWRYVGDRTGIISTANLILIWTFGIRNNTLMWLTGWDFATYNNFHRWVARVATVEAIVHSIAYTMLICDHGTTWSDSWNYYLVYTTRKYFWNGILATVFMSFICLFSIYGFRRNFYETFLLLHIILSVGVLVTMWYHVEIFLGAYNVFLYPCFFVWVLDRTVRFIRMLRFNPLFWRTEAQLSYSTESNMLRLVVPYSTSFVAPRPGTYYYISSLTSSQPWESHPFTLSYSTPKTSPTFAESELSLHPSHGTISPPQRFLSPPRSPVNSTFNRPSTPTSASNFESEALLKSSSTIPPPGTLTFLIRPYSGFTSRLQKSASRQSTTHRVLLDGPYGETQPLQKYQNVLFIVGGAGIAVPLSYLSLLLSDDSQVENVTVLWAVREEAFLSEALQTDFRGMLDDERLSLVAYITGDPTPRTAGQEQSDIGSVAGKSRGVDIHAGRPDISAAIEEVAVEVGKGGELAVVTCGPAQMADDARKMVVSLLGQGYGKVEYFEESFNW